jgi:hypothetical protein
MYYDGDKIMLVDDPKESLMNFIKEHFQLIMPFEVHDGFHFQIRISKQQYAKLKDTEIEKLKGASEYPSDEVENLDKADQEEYIKTRYWKHTNSYVYNYHIIQAFVLKTRCEYGCEGLDASVNYVFILKNYYSPVVMSNIDKYEHQDFIRAKQTKIAKKKKRQISVEIKEI